MREINISKFAGDNFGREMNEDSMVIQRDPNHCDLRPFEKSNKPKRAPPPLGWGRKKKKRKKRRCTIYKHQL